MSDNINDFHPKCPVIFFVQDNDNGPIHISTLACQKLDIFVACYVSTAIIRMEGEWTNQTQDTLDCVFALPTPGTVMNITIRIGDRVFTTAIMSHEDADAFIEENQTKSHQATNERNPYERPVRDLFRLPFSNVCPGDTISLKCEYLEPLEYYKKGYIVSIPLEFHPGTIVKHAHWDQVVHVQCKINTLNPNTKVNCWTHHIKTKNNPQNGAIIIECGTCKPLEEKWSTSEQRLALSKTGRDFELSYIVKSEKIEAHCIRRDDSLCIFITPPSRPPPTSGRAFFFLLDRSGSMMGEPYREALRAITKGLDRLRPSDQFNVCVFDHRQVYFQKTLVPANKEMVTQYKTWITRYVPERSGTTMDAPIHGALKQLQKSDLLPFIVLITDGAVDNERKICEKRKENKKTRARFIALGIGPFCNGVFLKMLSTLGRGWSEVVEDYWKIYHRLDHLLRRTMTPVLTDIEIEMKDEIDIYPFPIKDLMFGSPLVIAARYTSNKALTEIAIRGFNAHGDREIIMAKVETRNDIPVEKIFLKQRIDLMTADAWLEQSKQLEQKVIDVCMDSNMPSMFTSTVVFETTKTLFEEEEKKVNNKKRIETLASLCTAAVVAVSTMSYGNIKMTEAGDSGLFLPQVMLNNLIKAEKETSQCHCIIM